MRRGNVTYIVVLILLITGVVISWFIYTSPSYSLYKTKRAIEKHDYAMFSKYNNLDSIINNIMNKMSVNQLDSTDTLENLEMELLRSIAFGLRSQISVIVKKQLKRGIEKGKFKFLFGTKNQSPELDIKQQNMWEQIRTIRISDIQYVKKSCDNVIVGVNCNTDRKDRKFIFRIRMRRTGDHWQVVELADYLNLKKLMN